MIYLERLQSNHKIHLCYINTLYKQPKDNLIRQYFLLKPNLNATSKTFQCAAILVIKNFLFWSMKDSVFLNKVHSTLL